MTADKENPEKIHKEKKHKGKAHKKQSTAKDETKDTVDSSEESKNAELFLQRARDNMAYLNLVKGIKDKAREAQQSYQARPTTGREVNT